MNPTSEAILDHNNVSSHEVTRKENTNEGLVFTLFSYNADLSNTDDRDYFSAMPKETILHIFKFLSTLDLRRCAMVSKLWHEMSFSSELWSNATISSICIEVSFLERILNCNVKSIYFEHLKINVQKPLMFPLFKTPRFVSLQNITIRYSNVDVEIVEGLLSLSPNLKTIELVCVCEFVDINFFRQIVNLQFLEKLELCSLKIKYIVDITMILKNSLILDKLKTLSLSFYNIYPNMQWELSEPIQIFYGSFLALCPNLEVLSFPDIKINNAVFRYILNMHHLKDLNISNTIIDLNVTLPPEKNYEILVNLRNLNIKGTRTSENVKMFLLYLSPNLESLHIGGVIKDSIFEQIINIKNLRDLYFSDADFRCQNNFTKDERLINLRQLRISRTNMPDNVKLFLLDHSPNLEYLSMEGVITYSIFEQIINMKNLKELQFCDIDLTALNDFHSDEKFEKLRVLDVWIKKRLKKNVLNKLLSYCENLRKLTLSGFGIDQGFLKEILKMENLEKLSFLSIKSSTAFDTIKNSHKKLEKLKALSLIFEEPGTNPICAENILLPCKNLTDLVLGISYITERMWRCILSMNEIEGLFLYDLRPRNDGNIPNVEGLPKFMKLKTLAWSYTKRQFRPRKLEDLLSLCPNIDNLHLKFIFLTDTICRSIASMKGLKSLYLAFVSGITKNKIAEILKGCPKLTREKISIIDFPKK